MLNFELNPTRIQNTKNLRCQSFVFLFWSMSKIIMYSIILFVFQVTF